MDGLSIGITLDSLQSSLLGFYPIDREVFFLFTSSSAGCVVVTGNQSDIHQFLLENESLIQNAIDDSARMAKTAVKSYISLQTSLVRETEVGVQGTDTTFQSGIQFNNDFDINQVSNELTHQLEHFNREGSSWQFDGILSAKLTTAVYRPLAGEPTDAIAFNYIVCAKTIFAIPEDKTLNS